MLNMKVVVIFALPDDIEIEHRFEDVALDKLISSIQWMGTKGDPRSLDFDDLLEYLHDGKVDFLWVKQVA